MAEDSTRRLLKVFGMAVTDCEDALSAMEAALRASGSGAVPGQPLGIYEEAAREVDLRWAELGRLIHGYQSRAREALLAGVRARGAA